MAPGFLERADAFRKRDAEADSNGKLRDAAGPPEEGGEIVGQGVLRAGDAGSGNEIEKTRGARGDFREALVRGSRRAKEDAVEMVRGKNAAIVFGFFGSEIGGENAVGASRRESKHVFQGRVEGRIAGDDVGDDVELAGGAQFCEASGNAGRVGRYGSHRFLGNKL